MASNSFTLYCYHNTFKSQLQRLLLQVPECWYHVTSWGHGGEAIYRTEEDRKRFMGWVAELPERFGTEVQALVLRDNHDHLVVRCRRLELSEMLRWWQTAYAIRFNWAHHQRGHGDWGRDGTMAVATRPLGWRLVEVVRPVRGLKYPAVAQGIKRFWRRAAEDKVRAAFARRLKAICQ